MSANYLAERLKSYGIVCERKTIYKDLEELSDFGFDIIRDRKGAYLATRQFELPELKLLVDAVQSSRFITERKSEELISKLSKLLCKYDANSLKRQVIVKNRIKSMNESIYYNVDAVFEAMNKNCMISFRYGIWNAEKKLECKREGKLYRISPWYMQWENEKYYLIGYDGQARRIKHFRIDKLMQIQILSEKRQGKEEFGKLDMAAYGKQHFSMFQGKMASVTLLFDKDMAGVVLDRFGQDVWMHKEDEQHFRVVADVVVSSQFFGWLSGLGTKVHVLEPVWVREQYQKLLRSILDDI
ncbi:MAG: transcriptional regulator [Lachnospiraceae bacterium]|nr:transcriptional regulator [Lachnospiraceae bacterium]